MRLTGNTGWHDTGAEDHGFNATCYKMATFCFIAGYFLLCSNSALPSITTRGIINITHPGSSKMTVRLYEPQHDCMNNSMTVWMTIWLWRTVWLYEWPYDYERQYDCMNDHMNDSETVWPTVWQYDSMTVWQYDSMTVWPTVWQYDSMTVWQYDSMCLVWFGCPAPPPPPPPTSWNLKDC